MATKRHGSRSSWRVLCATAFVSALLFAPGALTDVPPSARGQNTTGALLFLDNGSIQRFDFATREPRLLVNLSNARVTHVTHSPDYRRIAYALNRVDAAFRLQGSEIVIANADGTDPRTVAWEVEPGYSVGWPSWTDDPGRLVYAKVNPARSVERVEEVDVATYERTLLVEGGSSPTGSPSASHVIFQREEGRRWSVWGLERGSEAPRQLVDARWFEDVDYPKFSPDGEWLAFAATGSGPTLFFNRLRDALVPRVSAHGLTNVVYDLWVMRPDGTGLRRVAPLNDFDPQVAWAPDGASIAAMGRAALQIVNVSTGAVDFLHRPQGSAPLSWGY